MSERKLKVLARMCDQAKTKTGRDYMLAQFKSMSLEDLLTLAGYLDQRGLERAENARGNRGDCPANGTDTVPSELVTVIQYKQVLLENMKLRS